MKRFLLLTFLCLFSTLTHAEFWNEKVTSFQDQRLEVYLTEWIGKTYPKSVKSSNIPAIAREVVRVSFEKGLKADLLVGVIAIESGFRPTAYNPSGAKGLMQVVPKWHKEKIRGRNLYKPEVAIDVGSTILQACMAKRSTTHGVLNCYSGYKGRMASSYTSSVLTKVKNFSQYVHYARTAPDKTIGLASADPLLHMLNERKLL